MTDAYVVGVDMIKFGRFPEKSVPQIGAESALMALDDCGLTVHDMEALYCGNLYQAAAMTGQRILQEIGQTGVPVVNVTNACATGATAFREAWASVKAGLYDIVIAVGVEQMGKGPARRTRRRQGHSQGRPVRLRHHARGIRRSRHGTRPQTRHHLRAVRQGVREKSPPLHHEPQGDVSNRDAGLRW